MTKDGQPLEDIFHWEKNFLCPERDLFKYTNSSTNRAIYQFSWKLVTCKFVLYPVMGEYMIESLFATEDYKS